MGRVEAGRGWRRRAHDDLGWFFAGPGRVEGPDEGAVKLGGPTT